MLTHGSAVSTTNGEPWPLESLSHNVDATKSYPISLDGSRSGRPRDLVTILILIHDVLFVAALRVNCRTRSLPSSCAATMTYLSGICSRALVTAADYTAAFHTTAALHVHCGLQGLLPV
jgi:hypothetical protein